MENPAERANREFVLAEGFERALAELDEMGTCRENRPSTGACTQQAAPDGPAYRLGTDQDGTPVYMRKWRCAAGHHYQMEVRCPSA